MDHSAKTTRLWYLIFFALIAYLLMNTGLVSDDISYTISLKGKALGSTLLPRASWLTTPIENYTHVIWYHFFRFENLTVNNFIKILYILLCFYFVTRFFGIYLRGANIFLVSFLFIFFPSHDSTVYWFLGQHLTLSISLYLYAYYMAYTERTLSAFLIASLASFLSYGVVAVALPLSLVFLMDKKIKKGLAILIPNAIYFVFYIFVTKIMSSGIDMVPAEIRFYPLSKQLVLQLLTFVDATLGPSAWLKIYYSFFQLSAISIIVGIAGTVIFYRLQGSEKSVPDRKLLLGLLGVTALSFVLFAVTGRYPQMAFNLGSRTTIFGSLFIAYLLTLLVASKKIKTIFFAIILFSSLGISDHWKDWYVRQSRVMQNIQANQSLKNYGSGSVIYVAGNQYSKYGPMSHIEFLSAPWVTYKLFKYLLNEGITAEPINKNYEYINGYLTDTKYNIEREVQGYINVYDSERDKLLKVGAADVAGYINSLPADNRHWVQIRGMSLKA